MKKRISHAFRKDVYLFGKDKNGSILWLEAPSWDCKWYWGFGYLEEYTSPTSPSTSRDIQMHTHVNSHLLNKDGIIDVNQLVDSTFTKAEGKELNRLFTVFYAMNAEAEKNHRSNPDVWKELNEKCIPDITGQILAILTPNKPAK